MQIKPLTKRNIEEIASLHLKALPDISALIGFPYVKKMYALIFNDPINHYGLGAWEDKNFIGFVILSKDMNLTHKLFHKLFSFKTFIILFFKVVTYKISPIRLFKRVMFERKLSGLIGGSYCCLGPICVEEKYQGKGIGSLLLTCMIKYVSKLKVDFLYVYTRFDNKSAFAFYKKMGFSIMDIFYDGVIFKRKINS